MPWQLALELAKPLGEGGGAAQESRISRLRQLGPHSSIQECIVPCRIPQSPTAEGGVSTGPGSVWKEVLHGSQFGWSGEGGQDLWGSLGSMCLDGVEVQRIYWGDMQKVEGGGCRSEQALANPARALLTHKLTLRAQHGVEMTTHPEGSAPGRGCPGRSP